MFVKQLKFNKIVFFGLLSALFLLYSCGGGRTFRKSPVDVMIRDMANEPVFSIILHDMEVEGSFRKSYQHKYKIIKEKDSVPYEKITDWLQVSEDYFWKNEANMGMEVASKDRTGKISKQAAPPGYNNYVGNSQYGHWRQSNGSSFWEFYGRYAFMSSMFNLMSGPIYRRDYSNYNNNYRNSRPYYGTTSSGGKPMYGSKSDWAKKSRPNFFKRRQSGSSWNRSTSRSRNSFNFKRSRGFGK